MIVTLTPNPNLDRTIRVPTMARGRVNRCPRSTVYPSGKGVNVARMLRANNVPTLAVFPAGGHNGQYLLRLLEMEAIPFIATDMRGDVRLVISVVEEDGTLTQFNEVGPELSTDELVALTSAALRSARRAGFFVASGSLPPGTPTTFYDEIIREADALGTPTALDTNAPILRDSLGSGPAVVKPNLHELGDATATSPSTLGDVVDAAGMLRRLGAASVLVSLGPDGAVLVDGRKAVHGELDLDRVANPVGAGDALLAGYLAGGCGVEGLGEGLAWAAAACRTPDTAAVGVTEADRATVCIRDSLEGGRVLGATKAASPF